MKEKYSFEDFLEIMDILRGENGCPWDLVQTHESIRENLLEEAYEAVDAIDNKDMENLCEELGDLLLHIVFHAKIEKEAGRFTIEDVIDGISRKMILRHPHVFGDDTAKTPDEVIYNWEENKKQEKGYKKETDRLKSMPKTLPALMLAYKVQNKASNSFESDNLEDAVKRSKEALDELYELYKNGEKTEQTAKIGEVLFNMVNISRIFEINPEIALTNVIKTFINRFEHLENMAVSDGGKLCKQTFKEMDILTKAPL